MSGTATWSAAVGQGSFFPGATAATPAELFGTFNAEASPDQHWERAQLLGVWLAARQDAPAATITAQLAAVRQVQAQANIGATSDVSTLWGPAAAAADLALDSLAGNYLASTADQRAISALRANGSLAQAAPMPAFSPGTFVAALAARGVVAAVGSGGSGVSYQGAAGILGPADQASIQTHRREIELFLVEQANATA
jgi:hypothetical protein